MPRAKNISQTHSEKMLEKAVEAAHHYGFCHLSEFIERNQNNDEDYSKEVGRTENDAKNNPENKNENKSSNKETPNLKESLKDFEYVFYDLAEIYNQNSLHQLPHPLFLYHSNYDLEENKNPNSNTSQKQMPFFALHAVGVSKNVAEAMVLKATFAILRDMGIEDISVSINSIGNSETAAVFDEELVSHFKKNLHIFPAQCRETFKRDTFETLQCVRKHSPVLLPSLPKPMQFLTEESRNHLREVVEYLDSEDIPYDLDDSLVGSKYCYRETIFEVHQHRHYGEEQGQGQDCTTMAKGGRYSELVRKIHNFELPSVGIIIFLKKEKEKPKAAPLPKHRIEHARIYLVHIGIQARIKSFMIIEELRRARIPILQSITNEQIATQLKDAEKRDISHLIIIGQKEAMEDTAIVRETKNQSQEIVPIRELVNYIKKKHKTL